MAGDWIKMNKSLPRDPRVVRISSALKADRLRTVGGLLSAWCLADEQTEDGKLEGYTPELLDELVGFPGLSRAMESVEWLTIGDGFLEFPSFEEHNGRSAKRRAQDSVRKMSARKADKRPQMNQTKSGPEKRREEKSIVPPNPQTSENRFRPPTLEEAIEAGAQLMIKAPGAEHWWNIRESSDWIKANAGGGTMPIRNWRADLAASRTWIEESSVKAEAAKGGAKMRL